MTKTQQTLFEITIAWNDYENSMGENAALEIACRESNKTSKWYYDNMGRHYEIVNKELERYYRNKKK